MTEQYPISKAAKILGVHIKTIQRWSLEGKLKVTRTPGGHRRIPITEIERLQTVQPN